MLQALSQQVLQPWLTLEGPSGDRGSVAGLADAIAYSLATPGAFLHIKLEVTSLSASAWLCSYLDQHNYRSGCCFLQLECILLAVVHNAIHAQTCHLLWCNGKRQLQAHCLLLLYDAND